MGGGNLQVGLQSSLDEVKSRNQHLCGLDGHEWAWWW